MKQYIWDLNTELFNLKNKLILWTFFWFLVMGIFVFGMKPFGINYLNYYYITCTFFIFSTILGIKVFDYSAVFKTLSATKEQYLIISIYTLLFFILGFYVDGIFPLSSGLNQFVTTKQIFFPLFRFETTLTKIIDIIFQQTMIIGLVLYLNDRLENKAMVIGVFTAVFFVLHIPLLIIFSWSGLIFILPSFLAGIIFSSLILYFKYGISYSIFVHQYFYLVLGLILRIHFT